MDCFGFIRMKVRILRELYKYPLGMVNINLMLALEMNSLYDKQQNIEVVYVKIEILLFNSGRD
jgi:hypothetical protein